MSAVNIGVKKLFLAVLAGVALAYGVNYFVMDDKDQNQKIQSLENTIKDLESSLAKKEAELDNVRLLALHKSNATNTGTVTEICKQVKESQNAQSESQPKLVDSAQSVKKLETISENDRRPLSEKLSEFLSGNPEKEKIAVASRIIFDTARDDQALPDYALQSMYSTQTDPDLKRVIAQVLSQRGNDTLLDNQITESQARLKSAQPKDRQEALDQLAKMRNVKAVDVIAPYLHDPDINVKLDALQALRDTGNQQAVSLVEMMVNDPNPNVSSLARDVANDLSDLSSTARTSLSTSDIEAGLPQMQNP